jgi:toluene monooxygenase system ferredoxin subunit
MVETPEFTRVCNEDDLWAGEMASYEVKGVEILVVRTNDGEVKALQGVCPHQRVSLVRGELDGDVLTCMAHRWSFNVVSAKSVNPDDAELETYPVKIEDGGIYVSIDGITPKFSHA